MKEMITLYKQRLNLQNATFSRIEHEDAIIAIVYKVSQPNGMDYILKICPNPSHYLCEIYFLNYFSTILPVPRLIEIVEPEEDLYGAILMEFLPGALLKTADLNADLAYQVGSVLAKIHSHKTIGYGDLTQSEHLKLDPIYHFELKFEESFSECIQHLPKDMLDQCHYYYDKHIHYLKYVDGPCIIHRDFRPGNVIVNHNKLHGIIDWAGARASFAEEDFCPLEFGEWSADKKNKKFFLEGYASIRPAPDYKNVMPLLRLSRAIAAIGFMVKTNTWENKNVKLYQRNRQFLDEFFRKR